MQDAARSLSAMMMSDSDLSVLKLSLDEEHDLLCSKAMAKERYIGIDQGIHTFSIVAIDKQSNSTLRLVGAEQYHLQNLCKLTHDTRRFSIADLMFILQTQTDLFNWMQFQSIEPPNFKLDYVERVVVLLEQMSPQNAFWRQFGKDFGEALQQAFNTESCVVKLSQPHIHRKDGPMFKLGNEIIKTCQLTPPSEKLLPASNKTKRIPSNANRPVQKEKRRRLVNNDYQLTTALESDDSCTDREDKSLQSSRRRIQNDTYRAKKKMSAAVFRYHMPAS